MLIDAFASVAIVPVETLDRGQVDHLSILP
jgi:hypothetical protein